MSTFVSGDVRRFTESLPDAPLFHVVFGQLLRVDAWLRSLARLTEPVDFQPIAAGCRALLETAVDVVLIEGRDANAQLVLDWERSAKQKHAMAIRNYLTTSSSPMGEHKETVAFATTNEGPINAVRTRNGWVDRKGQPIHPSRWTKRSLDTDCLEADKMYGAKSAFSFVRFYETRYRTICWDVHGSALAVRTIGQDVFPFIAARCLGECAEISVIAARACLEGLGRWTKETDRLFSKLPQKRQEIRERAFASARAAAQEGGS